MRVDQAGRHRQSPGVEPLAGFVAGGGPELGDPPVFDGDVDVYGVAPRPVGDRRADHL
ncbi:hypothetical protein ACFPOI_29630 [Nonomuraea angiospora]|uniref:hypothetical protein n=1 Tax=Nonomuraea angiospora TaxID=46172 RepID=UPI00361C91DC